MNMARYGLVEAGGTKFVLGVATDKDTIEATTRIDTMTPDETIGAMLDWFRAHGRLDAIGVASFGPLELDRLSPNWGHVGQTPKLQWSGADIAGPLQRAFDCPVAIDTDVNGAALAEYHWGAGQGQRSGWPSITVGWWSIRIRAQATRSTNCLRSAMPRLR